MTTDSAPVPRRRGRPRIPEEQRLQSEVLHVRIAVDAYDRLCREALRRGVSLNAIARKRLEAPLADFV